MSKEKQQKQAETCEAEDVKDIVTEAPDGNADLQKELDTIKGELDEKAKQCTEYFDKFQRAVAEFDNFKKRTIKEKEALYIDAAADVIGAFIPVLDNVERAIQAMSESNSVQTLKEGVEMVFKQFKETLKCVGVEEIKAVNGPFDPILHNAVMHVEDEAFGQNIVIEEFEKGYIYKDKVIRYSIVKVAN